MVRLASFTLILGTIWLAYTALPEESEHRRLERIVGIIIDGDPQTSSINQAHATPRSSGRKAAEVFGLDSPSSSQTASAAKSATSGTVASAPSAQPVAPPARKPWHVAYGTVADVAPKSEARRTRYVFKDDLPKAWQTTVRKVSTETAIAPRNELKEASAKTDLNAAPTPTLSKQERRRVARHLHRELRRVGC